MADMKKVYDDLIIINLYNGHLGRQRVYKTIHLQYNFYLFYLSKLNMTSNSYKKFQRFTNSRLPNWPKSAKSSYSVSRKELTEGVY